MIFVILNSMIFNDIWEVYFTLQDLCNLDELFQEPAIMALVPGKGSVIVEISLCVKDSNRDYSISRKHLSTILK